MSFESRFGAVSRAVDKEAKKALLQGAEMVLTKAKQEVPVDTGALLRSGTRKTQNSGDTQELSFNTPYAHRQHEDLTYNHPNGGNAKYLENPLRAEAPKVLELIKSGMAKGLIGGV